ncbi:MAG: hypothetical protein JXB29_05620 [Sedimentisphaerales bacterium]|nr:hypothetical protein [Sedimentisphaerales bacterium]
MNQEDIILEKYQMLAPELNERALRLFAAAEALSFGWGGISLVSRALEISRGIKAFENVLLLPLFTFP